jgi:hypothetical protein
LCLSNGEKGQLKLSTQPPNGSKPSTSGKLDMSSPRRNSSNIDTVPPSPESPSLELEALTKHISDQSHHESQSCDVVDFARRLHY